MRICDTPPGPPLARNLPPPPPPSLEEDPVDVWQAAADGARIGGAVTAATLFVPSLMYANLTCFGAMLAVGAGLGAVCGAIHESLRS